MGNRLVQKTAAVITSVALMAISSAVLAKGASAVEHGLWGEYYSGDNFETYVTGRTDSNLDFSWSNQSPVSGLGTEHFSIRWTGRIMVTTSDSYTFITNADDGVKLWIDGNLLVNDAGPHYPAVNTAPVTLEAGKYYDIEVDYYNGALGGTMQLYWQSQSIAKQIVPADIFYRTEYETAVDLSYNADSETASARVLNDDGKNYKLVMEKYDMDGNKIDEKSRSKGSAGNEWNVTDSLTDNKSFIYKAYVIDAASGNTASNIVTRPYGVDGDVGVDIDSVNSQTSPYLYGACLEDVNHELYGGLWSQLIYGESFAEDAQASILGYAAVGGAWYTKQGTPNEVWIDNAEGDRKLILDNSSCTAGTFSADVFVNGNGPTGFVTKVTDAKPGGDQFNGYEIGLSNNMLNIGKHQYNYSFISSTPCTAPLNTWNNLKVVMTENTMTVYVNGIQVTSFTDPNPLTTGQVGFRSWQAQGGYKNIKLSKDGGSETAIDVPYNQNSQVSGMWRQNETGNVAGSYTMITDTPFSGSQSQRMQFVSGSGTVGIDNKGLNRQGIAYTADKDYDGYFYAKSDGPTDAYVVLESADGSRQYAETKISVKGNQWTKYSFTVRPDTTDASARFSIKLKSPGTLDLGYVFFEPGEWGRYNGLSVRKDVAEMLKNQGVTVLRFGGSMVNNDGYRWKSMLGAPETRPNYKGTWNDHSSLGFGIVEFMNLCEQLDIVGIPDFNSYETPQDMADFIDFATGTDTDNQWVQKRIAMGHSAPYDLHYIEIGNEEKIDAAFAARFNRIADAVWAKDSHITLVAGDFAYRDAITDPYNITGADSGITSLEGQKAILDHATENHRSVWFDLHIWDDRQTQAISYFNNAVSFYNSLKQICPDADFKIAIFELNADIHSLDRALANAYAINRGERLSDIFPIICSANCLQVDGQNDNGWDQGLVFMNTDSTWYQPPAYITQMASKYAQPNVLDTSVTNRSTDFDVTATASDDKRTVVLKVVNNNDGDYTANIHLPGFTGNQNQAVITVLTGNLNDVNTAANPANIAPSETAAANPITDNAFVYSFAPHSYTVIELKALSDPDNGGSTTSGSTTGSTTNSTAGSPTTGSTASDTGNSTTTGSTIASSTVAPVTTTTAAATTAAVPTTVKTQASTAATAAASGYTIKGQLLSGGKPVANTAIELHSTVQRVTTDANGRFTFTDVESGSHTITVLNADESVAASMTFEIKASGVPSPVMSDGVLSVPYNVGGLSLNLNMDNGLLTISNVKTIANPSTGDSAYSLIFAAALLACSSGVLVVGKKKKASSNN